jgi:hypothetical protein
MQRVHSGFIALFLRRALAAARTDRKTARWDDNARPCRCHAEAIGLALVILLGHHGHGFIGPLLNPYTVVAIGQLRNLLV